MNITRIASLYSSFKGKALSYLLLVVPLMMILMACTQRTASSGEASSSVQVSVERSSPIGTSQFSPAISYVDNSLDYPWNSNDATAVSNVRSLIKQGIPYQNTYIMAWGAPDPWPNPSQKEPSNWGYLDTRLQLIRTNDGIPIISLSEAPWWMKGELEQNGTTHVLAPSDEWSDIAYTSRILDNKMNAWLHLVQRVAERYMVAPYNVRYFQVWNELKGYYDPITNAYDYTTSPGKPNGSNARHGYTYMYNQVYARLLQVAASLKIPKDSIKVGGPYVPLDTWASHNQSTASHITKAYGTYDQRPLDVVLYWLQHKAGAGFITLDGANSNKDGKNLTDAFVASEKFADMTSWIRSLDNGHYPGAKTLPIWWAEWYAVPYSNTPDVQYNNALKSYAVIKLLKAGGAVMLSWGARGDGPSNTGLWTSTDKPGGGKPLPWYYSYKAFKDYFPPGTQIYKTTVSAPNDVEALASASHIILVNRTGKSLSVHVNGTVSLRPFQVSVVRG